MLKSICFVAGIISLSFATASGASSRTPINDQAQPRSAVVRDLGIAIPTPELYFVPTNTCKLFDRIIPANTLSQNVVAGTTGFEDQGGVAGGCGVPASASAISINITSVSTIADGKLQVGAAGIAGSVTALAYRQGETIAGNMNARLGTGGKINVATAGGGTRVVGYVNGYFVPQIVVYMNPDGTVYSSTSRVGTTEKINTGVYRITFDRNIYTCAISLNIAGGAYYGNAYPEAATSIIATTWALNADAGQVPTDLYFQLGVRC